LKAAVVRGNRIFGKVFEDSLKESGDFNELNYYALKVHRFLWD